MTGCGFPRSELFALAPIVQRMHKIIATIKGDNQREATVARLRRAPEELFSASNTLMSQGREEVGSEVEGRSAGKD